MWLSLLIKNWKYAVMGVLLITIASLYLVIKIQGIRLDRKDIELSVYKATYASQREAITNLQKDIESANKTCAKRLNSKDALIRELQRIDSIGENPVEGDSPDMLLNELNGMFRSPL